MGYRLRIVLAVLVIIIGVGVGWLTVSSFKAVLDLNTKSQNAILQEIGR